MGSQFASEPQALLSILFLNVAFMIRKGGSGSPDVEPKNYLHWAFSIKKGR